MKTNLFTKTTLAFLLVAISVVTSCKKEANNSANADFSTLESAESNNEADGAFDDVFNNTMGIGSDANGESLGITSGVGVFSRQETGNFSGRVDSLRCFTLTVSPTEKAVFPKTVVIDFGNGCEGKDGKIRTGKIITIFTGPMRIPGSKATTTFENYTIDSATMQGTHIVTNNSTSTNRILSTQVIDGQLNWVSGRWVKWSSNRTVEQIEGNGTELLPLDDVFSITGSGRGENSRGKTWGHETEEPLMKKFACNWISKGLLRITHNGNIGKLNYGDGRCDNKAELTINGKVKIVTLR